MFESYFTETEKYEHFQTIFNERISFNDFNP